ncbi:unnamed protein product [Meloidogyne enterolobii]|uniref:Uncharacterized protein n=1 Tax=Meloidogyne enterolobii TaxID=390850 RepID=A0ACB0Y4W3_MELEN
MVLMFARCSTNILNCNDIYFTRIVYQSSKAALSKKEIERQKKALGNARVSSRITGKIRKWIRFLKAENSAIQNSVTETTKRFESKCPELSLSVLNSWYEAPEGVLVEFSFRKLESTNVLSEFSSIFKNGSHVILKSRNAPSTEIPAVIVYFR